MGRILPIHRKRTMQGEFTMSTNNVMMTENDKRNVGNADLQKQIKEEKHKINFIKDVDKLLKKYNCQKIICIWRLKSQVLTQIVSYT